jgi:hypothetical protein
MRRAGCMPFSGVPDLVKNSLTASFGQAYNSVL